MIKIAVYGSLRPGHYNFKRLESIYPGCFNHLSTNEIEGFTMFNLGAYPGIVKNTLLTEEVIYNKVIMDVLECNDRAFSYIQAMEINAGYEEETIMVGEHECKVFHLPRIPNADIVETGDWNEYYEKIG